MTPDQVLTAADRLTDTVATKELCQSPLVSVLMLTYNHCRYVGRAVESALKQDAEFEWEIVIGDDASSDGTVEILRSLQARNPRRIKLLLARENLGGATGTTFHANFLRAYSACRGRFIALLEGDDCWIDPGKLRLQAEMLERHPECTLCWHPGRIDYIGAAAAAVQSLGSVFPKQPFPEINPGRIFFFGNQALTASMMWRGGTVARWPDFLCQLPALDWVGHLMHACKGRAAYIDRQMCVYRCHPDSVWSSRPVATQTLAFAKTMCLANPLLPVEDRPEGLATVASLLVNLLRESAERGLGNSPGKTLAEIAALLADPALEQAFSRRLADLAKVKSAKPPPGQGQQIKTAPVPQEGLRSDIGRLMRDAKAIAKKGVQRAYGRILRALK